MKSVLWLIAVFVALPAQAAVPGPSDFAYGLRLETVSDKPLQTLTVPDAVYQQSVRSNLDDIRVFNANDVAVPYALCPAELPAAPSSQRRTLPVFALRARSGHDSDGARVQVETDGGTRIQVLERVSPNATPPDDADRQAAIIAYVIDVRGLPGRIRAILPVWHAPGGASEQWVRLQASADLEHWRTIVEDAALLRAEGDDGVLEHNRIAVPPGDYRYLRVAPRGAGPLPRIEQVRALLQSRPARTKAVTITARPVEESGAANAATPTFVFDSQRRAPIQAATVDLPARNMALRVALDSRAPADDAWQPRWRGAWHDLAGVVRPLGWTPIHFAAATDRYWRLRVVEGADSLAGRALGLRLIYHPRRLRFLAQGDGPFVLAYGSARAPAATRECGALAGDLTDTQRRAATGTATIARAAITLGGPSVVQRQALAIPIRRYVLWGVLIAGALVLAGLALVLLRRIRQA